jgi:hypothetical protein
MPRQNEQVNEIWICDKGRFASYAFTQRERLTEPLVRDIFFRSLWLAIAAIPLLLPAAYRLAALVAGLATVAAIGAVSSCGLSAWVRDLVPDGIAGRFFAKRLAVATAVGASLSLGAASLSTSSAPVEARHSLPTARSLSSPRRADGQACSSC